MQIKSLYSEINKLQAIYGSSKLAPIYGTGCVKKPRVVFMFMNPTGKNISASPAWSGFRAPWLGTKNVWKLIYKLNLISEKNYQLTQKLKSNEWTSGFSRKLYGELARNKIYITNLAKCTQDDARMLPDKIFKEYLPSTRREILLIKPQKIILFGNQVSSIMLNKRVRVSEYKEAKSEILEIEGFVFKTYPVYYPVGQGQRNMPLAIKRVEKILAI